jgi:hypothetical protein
VSDREGFLFLKRISFFRSLDPPAAQHDQDPYNWAEQQAPDDGVAVSYLSFTSYVMSYEMDQSDIYQ